VATISEHEEQVNQLINEGKKDAAVNLLFKLVVACAKNKDFMKAEAFRDKLMAVDAFAFDYIIRSGEVIEEEKAKSIDKEHWKIWSKLYNSLSTENANTLYYSMKTKKFEADQVVYKQGDRNHNLYFIDKGELKMIYTRDKNEFLLTTLKAGDLAGDDTFFYSSAFSTTSLITLSKVEMHFLERAVLKEWKEKAPALEPSLNDYYRDLEKVHDLLTKKNIDRRVDKRVNVSGIIVCQLLSSAGELSGRPFKGSLADISVGGLSFYFRITKKENASLLLGRKLTITLDLPNGEIEERVVQVGTIVSVRYHPFGDHSIHVKFEKALNQKFIIQAQKNVAPPKDAQPQKDLKRKPTQA